jgi:hypothetical protein
MSHSGVCLPRHYAAFAGIAYGHKVNRFFERLVGRGLASACPSLHNRGLVYHVQHRALYAVVGEPHSRFRRPVPAAAIAARLMVLDAVIGAPEVRWLPTAREKAEHFSERVGVPVECLPSRVPRKGDGSSRWLFPDALPVGIEGGERTVIVFPVTPISLQDFAPFLRRHRALLSSLAAWTLRLVVALDDRPGDDTWRAVVDREIGALLASSDEAERRVDWCRLPHRYGHLSPWLTLPIGSGSEFTRGHQRGNTASHVLNPLVVVIAAGEVRPARMSACEQRRPPTLGHAWVNARHALGVRAAFCAARLAGSNAVKGGDGA